jgi:hypothetical protein
MWHVWEKREMFLNGYGGNIKKRDNLQDLKLDEIIILNKTEGHGLDSFGLRKGQVTGYC